MSAPREWTAVTLAKIEAEKTGQFSWTAVIDDSRLPRRVHPFRLPACNAPSPDGLALVTYRCNRPAGHKDRHSAGSLDEIVAVWEQR